MKFKAGDKVRCLVDNYWTIDKGEIKLVSSVTDEYLYLKGFGHKYFQGFFELASTPHVHCDLIKAWADGAEIEVNLPDKGWVSAENPHWVHLYKYRIKQETTQQQEIIRIKDEMRKLADDLAKLESEK